MTLKINRLALWVLYLCAINCEWQYSYFYVRENDCFLASILKGKITKRVSIQGSLYYVVENKKSPAADTTKWPSTELVKHRKSWSEMNCEMPKREQWVQFCPPIKMLERCPKTTSFARQNQLGAIHIYRSGDLLLFTWWQISIYYYYIYIYCATLLFPFLH
jgi:hypothetical protein